MNQIRSTRSVATLVAGALLVVNACNSYSTDPATDLLVQTAQTVYEIPAGSSSLTIHATVTNTLDETLLLDGLGRDFLRLEKRVGDSWRLAYSPAYILRVPEIELPFGAARQTPIGLSFGNEFNTAPKFVYEVPGTYRAVFAFRTAGGKDLPVYSNDFELRLAQ
ncbi:MAG: hypothetical protein ACR2L6_03585 [Gemmatimonadaceae bacterium]